jgi:hypothetical protein
MRPGEIGVNDERPPFTLGGHRLRRAAQLVTWELVDLLPQRREETFRYDGRTEGRAFDIVLSGLTLAAAALLFPARALRLADLPFRVGRLPVAGEPAPKGLPYARAGSQSPLSHAYAAFTVDSNAAP